MRDGTRLLLHSLRDMGLGALIFLMLAAVTVGASPSRYSSTTEAIAGEVIATRAVEVSSPAGPAAENAIVAAAQLRPAPVPNQAKRRSTGLAVLGFTFSLLVALNLAFWRHLRWVSDVPAHAGPARQP